MTAPSPFTESHPIVTITPTTQEQRLWTTNDIAIYASLHPSTVRNMQHRRKLPPPIRIGRSVRWSSAAIVDHFAAMQVPA